MHAQMQVNIWLMDLSPDLKQIAVHQITSLRMACIACPVRAFVEGEPLCRLGKPVQWRSQVSFDKG